MKALNSVCVGLWVCFSVYLCSACFMFHVCGCVCVCVCMCVSLLSGGIWNRCPNHLSWLLSTRRSSGSTPSSLLMSELHTLSLRLSPATLWRKLISAACIRDLVLCQGCPLSPVLFVISMDKISRRSLGVEQVRFGGLGIASLLFADDVVLLASSDRHLRHSLERFAAECEAAGIRVSTSKSEAMVPGNQWIAPSRWGQSAYPKRRSLSISGFYSWVRVRWSRRSTGGSVRLQQ